VHSGSLVLLVGAAAVVAVVHSILPDHWVPIALVARTQSWSLVRVARISALASGGHVLASLGLAWVIALIGLRFQRLIDTQQGHIIGGVLVLTGLGLLIWNATGHGDDHSHDTASHVGADQADEPGHEHGDDHPHHGHAEVEATAHESAEHEYDPHDHQHTGTAVPRQSGPRANVEDHLHEHEHPGLMHTHAHRHEAFIRERAQLLAQRSQQRTLAARLATIAVPFGVAASPDLTILPVALAASAYGAGAVASVLVIFGAVTMATFVALTLVATAAGYQIKGLWLEKHANTVTSLVLIGIGVVAYLGF
jgi:hypothetical protein